MGTFLLKVGDYVRAKQDTLLLTEISELGYATGINANGTEVQLYPYQLLPNRDGVVAVVRDTQANPIKPEEVLAFEKQLLHQRVHFSEYQLQQLQLCRSVQAHSDVSHALEAVRLALRKLADLATFRGINPPNG